MGFSMTTMYDNKDLEDEIGYSFTDQGREVLIQALTHKSKDQKNNERLEFLGDAVLSQIVADHLFHEYPGEGESVLTRQRSVLTDRVALHMVGERIGIGKKLILGESLQGKTTNKLIADAVEALIGAVYLDGGIESARCVVHKIILNDELKGQLLKRMDWITLLKEHTDANHLPQPKYLTFENQTGDAPAFLAWVTLDTSNGQGTGMTKKSAMAKAAEDLMSRLDQAR